MLTLKNSIQINQNMMLHTRYTGFKYKDASNGLTIKYTHYYRDIEIYLPRKVYVYNWFENK